MIGDGTRIDDGTLVGSFCDIGKEVTIGRNCNIQAHATISNGCRIGSNVFIAHITMSNFKASYLLTITLDDHGFSSTNSTIRAD